MPLSWAQHETIGEVWIASTNGGFRCVLTYVLAMKNVRRKDDLKVNIINSMMIMNDNDG